MVASIILGSIFDYVLNQSKMAGRWRHTKLLILISLGSCIFGIDSKFAFETGPSAFDGARVAASVVKGIGFVGSALILKVPVGNYFVKRGKRHIVTGLYEATALWISASIGAFCAGGLYAAALGGLGCVYLSKMLAPHTQSKKGKGNTKSKGTQRCKHRPGNMKDKIHKRHKIKTFYGSIN